MILNASNEMIDLTSEYLQAGKCVGSKTYDTYCGKKATHFYEIYIRNYRKDAKPSSYVCFCKSCDEKCIYGDNHVAITQEEFTMKTKVSKAKKPVVETEADSAPVSSETPVQPKVEGIKVAGPSKEELEKLVWEKPMPAAAKEIGISVLTLRKRCKKFEIKTPPVGHWSKKDRA